MENMQPTAARSRRSRWSPRDATGAGARAGSGCRTVTLVRAFASVGRLWGGRWTAAPDYERFSSTGGQHVARRTDLLEPLDGGELGEQPPPHDCEADGDRASCDDRRHRADERGPGSRLECAEL